MASLFGAQAVPLRHSLSLSLLSSPQKGDEGVLLETSVEVRCSLFLWVVPSFPGEDPEVDQYHPRFLLKMFFWTKVREEGLEAVHPEEAMPMEARA